MSLELGLTNLWFYSLQTGTLIVVGGLLVWILRFRDPGGLYVYWRLLLAGCLILTFQPGVPDPLADPASNLLVEDLIRPVTPVKAEETSQAANVYPLLGGIVVSGIALRLIWLALGFYRLGRLTRRSRTRVLPQQLQELQPELGVSARFRVSEDIDGPVTFGFVRPVVILPESLFKMPEEMQRAILCHELLHVKRMDWLWNTLEEFVRTLFWFHPAFHWLIGRVQLTRELVVDQQVVTLLGSRKAYLQSLVEIARLGNSAPALPAPLFLKECQLSRRVRLMLQLREVKMSRTNKTISLVTCFSLLGVIGWWTLSTIPLLASPTTRMLQEESAAPEPQIIHRVDPEMPVAAHVAGMKGVVILKHRIDEEGQVRDLEATKGEPMLKAAVKDAVSQWRYKPVTKDGVPVQTEVILAYYISQTPDPEKPGLLLRIDEAGKFWDQDTQLKGSQLLQRAREAGNIVVIQPDLKAPGDLIFETAERLKQSGIDQVFVVNTTFVEL